METKTRVKFATLFMIVVSIVVFAAIPLYLGRQALHDEYISNLALIIICFFGLLLVIATRGFFNLDVLRIREGYLSARSVFGYIKWKIELKDVVKYREIGSDKISFKKFELYTASKLYKISFDIISNDGEFRDKIRIGQKVQMRQKEYLRIMRNKVLSLVATGTGIGICTVFLVSIARPQHGVVKDALVIIKGTLDQREISGNFLEPSFIYLAEYPGTRFAISGSCAYAFYKRAFSQNVKFGDSLTVEVKRNEYLKYISKELPPDFFDTYILPGKTVKIFGLSSRDHQYFELKLYNSVCEKDAGSILKWIFLCGGAILLVSGILSLRNSY